jgi:hypothetical protein
MGATGPLESDEAADDLLGLAAPDPVLLAGPDREGQAGVPHRAGLADGDGLRLELRGVGEERVVVERHDLEARGLITPAPDLGHAARPPCRHATRARRLTVGVAGAASVGLMARGSGPPGGGCRRDRGDRWGSADASGFASGMQRD